ncbi:MAG: hypothetical protein ACE5NM_08630 [Sedimentisphaerales bacterium]
MSRNNIDTSTRNPEKISHKIEQVSFNSVRKVLPDTAIVQACKAVGYKYRERKITPIVTVLHMIMAAIWPDDSFNASWQVLWASLVSRFANLSGESPSRGNVSQARTRLPIKLWRFLFKLIRQKGQELSPAFDKWRGYLFLCFLCLFAAHNNFVFFVPLGGYLCNSRIKVFVCGSIE